MALTPPTPAGLALRPNLPLLPQAPDHPDNLQQQIAALFGAAEQIVEWATKFDWAFGAAYQDLATRLTNGFISQKGTATITGAATTAAVAFGGLEPDTDYQVYFAVNTLTDATPAAGSTRPYVASKATTGFTITLEAAPGGSDVVTLAWMVVR